jgi:hypothetical protein
MFQYGRSNVDWVLCLLDALCSSRDWATFEEEQKKQQPAALLHYKVGSCAAAHSCLSMLHDISIVQVKPRVPLSVGEVLQFDGFTADQYCPRR